MNSIEFWIALIDFATTLTVWTLTLSLAVGLAALMDAMDVRDGCGGAAHDFEPDGFADWRCKNCGTLL